jgi:primase-polymerase (primpol)-like protein
VPKELRKLIQWVLWRKQRRKGRPTKVPYCAMTGGLAATDDPRTWSSYDAVAAAFNARPGRYAGIGFVFSQSDQFCGVDLDGCVGSDGVIAPVARAILDDLKTYAEFSPSGTGIKLVLIGTKPPWARCRSKKVVGLKEIEIYDEGRFFALTGARVPSTPPNVEDRQPQLEALCQRLWPKNCSPHLNGTVASAGFTGDDAALVHRAGAAKNGDKFKKLWAGDTSLYGGDDSSADLAFCSLLAFWTGKDAPRMDRIFRLSGLIREKWDERRGETTYRQMTIDRAIADCAEVFSPRRRRSPLEAAAAATDAEQVAPADDPHGLVPLGQHDPVTGRLVLSPKRTLPSAEAYVREFNRHPEGRTLHGYCGVFMDWRGNRYCEVEDEWLKQRLQAWLHAALRYVLNKKT